MNATKFSLSAVSALLATALAACGGGGGGGAAPTPAAAVDPAVGSAILLGSSTQLANQCAPENSLARDAQGNLLSGYRSGSRLIEQSFVRAYLQENYLWYQEMPASLVVPPTYTQAAYQDGMSSWFRDLLSPQKNANGARKDRFSFAMPTADWKAQSQAGAVSGYGVDLGVLKSEVPRDVRVTLVTPGTPAERLNVARGDRLLWVVTAAGKRIDVVNTEVQEEVDELNRVLFKANEGENTGFEFRPVEGGEKNREVELSAGQYTAPPVQTTRVIDGAGGAKVGYVLFNGFNLLAEAQLVKAVTEMQGQQVQDVVVDLRYNGGGYLYQSAQLAYMLSDPTLTKDKVFERLQYNDKRRKDESLMRFLTVTSGTEGTNTRYGQTLPNLGLKRVYVLTGNNTCSASESLINGLRGVDVEVVQIGNTTCGKPYGFTAHDNCGMSYFPIEFNGVNDKGVGGFDAGFEPTCKVADDLEHQLGDPNERLLAAALHHRQYGQCPATASTKALGSAAQAGLSDPQLVRSPAQTSKFVLP